MMKDTAVTIFLALMSAVFAQAQDKVFTSDFGAWPDDGRDDTEALRKAAEYVRTHEGSTLIFSPGEYVLRDEAAIELENTVMSGGYGPNPEPRMFTPYHEYVRGLDFTGAKNVTIQAARAVLKLDGWMEGLSVENTENFTVNGLTIDFVRHPQSEGKIIDIQWNSYTVEFDKADYQLTTDAPFTRVNIWDNSIDGHFVWTHGFNADTVLAPNVIRFKGWLPEYLLGARLGAAHTYHYRPVIFIHESQNTVLNDVTINANCGMGIVGFHTNTVKMNRMNIIPAEGRRFSTNTDATHFAACEGEIVFDGCTFCGQGDDATNIHGYYHDITAVDGKTATLDLKAPTFTHAQISDVPRIGDELTLVRIRDLKPVGKYRVKAVDHKDREIPYTVTLNRTLPEDFTSYYLINSTLMPRVVFQNCVDRGHFARGVLIKTNAGTVIQNNVFRGITHSAIVLSSEANWKEGWHSENVVIRGNRIIDCGICRDYNGAGIALNIVAEDADDIRLHDNIVIEDNEIISTLGNECGIYVANARRVRIYGNTITGCNREIIVENADVKMK